MILVGPDIFTSTNGNNHNFSGYLGHRARVPRSPRKETYQPARYIELYPFYCKSQFLNHAFDPLRNESFHETHENIKRNRRLA